MKKTLTFAAILLFASVLRADVSVTDRDSTLRHLNNRAKTNKVSPAEKAAQIAANQAKRDAKRAKRQGNSAQSSPIRTEGILQTDATGSVSLIDAAGLQYFINTNITFSTTSSASGAASEASFTAPIVASTSAGGTTTSTLNDSFDGYNTICVSLTGGTGPCATGNPDYTFYNQNGPAAFDTTVPATAECTNRQVAFPAKTIGPLSVTRKVFVPTNDEFARWYTSFTNTSGAPVTFNAITGNNLGSDSNTIITGSSSGDNTATVADTWVGTFQNFSGSTSSDPRLGHVLQGTGATTPLTIISFANGDDNPFWGYAITLAPGETKSIVNFATGQGTQAAANAQAATLAGLPASSTQCLSATEFGQISNFAIEADLSIVKTASSPSVTPSSAYSYTINVSNGGPATTDVTVTDALPAGVTFVSAMGIGWNCSEVAGVVTCTMSALAPGAASPITINVTAPATPGPVSNTATVASSGGATDPDPADNSSTVVVTVASTSADLSITKTTGTTQVTSGGAISYTIQVTNAGPAAANNVTVTDVLPAGTTFVSATGTGWSCSFAAGTVTCTMATLAVGPANPITLVINAPITSTPGTVVNTATVTSTSPDQTPGNNASTSTVALVAAALIPTLSGWMLIALAATLAFVGLRRFL